MQTYAATLLLCAVLFLWGANHTHAQYVRPFNGWFLSPLETMRCTPTSGNTCAGVSVTAESPITSLNWKGDPNGGHFEAVIPNYATNGLYSMTITVPTGYQCNGTRWRIFDYGPNLTDNTLRREGFNGCTVYMEKPPRSWQYGLEILLNPCPPSDPTCSIPPPPPPPVCDPSLPFTSFPTNATSSCINPGNQITISWNADPQADYYSLRINSYSDLSHDWNTSTCPPAVSGPGDHCIDVVGTSYTFVADPNAIYSWWMHSRNSCDQWGPAVFGANRCVPNCSNMQGPSFLTVGQQGMYVAEIESLDGNLEGEIFRALPGNTMSPLAPRQSFPGVNYNTMTGFWTPTAADIGTHNICCRAFNDNIAECRPPFLVDGPPRYDCLGPNVCRVVTVIDIPPWYKMKDTSFHRQGVFNVTIPTTMQPFDADDSSAQYPIIGQPGMLSTTANTLTVNSSNTNEVSSLNWQAREFSDENSFLANIPAFIEYARARKNARVITALNQITTDNAIYIFNGNLTINNTNRPPPGRRNYLLIVNGNITFGTPGVNFNPAGVSTAIIATGQMNIAPGYNTLTGIFIASGFDLATGVASSATPLKINGNLISQTPVTTAKRERADSDQPSIFIVMRPQMYIDLLPLLSTIVQEGRQIE